MLISNYPLDKCIRREHSEYKIENGILTYKTNYYYAKEFESEYAPREETKCYIIGNLSYFWWSYFGYDFKKVKCSNLDSLNTIKP